MRIIRDRLDEMHVDYEENGGVLSFFNGNQQMRVMDCTQGFAYIEVRDVASRSVSPFATVIQSENDFIQVVKSFRKELSVLARS